MGDLGAPPAQFCFLTGCWRRSYGYQPTLPLFKIGQGEEVQNHRSQQNRLHTPNQPVPSLKCGAEPWETQEEGQEHLPSIRCPSCCPVSLDSVSEEGGSTGLSANTPVVPTFEAGSRPTSPCCPIIWPEPLLSSLLDVAGCPEQGHIWTGLKLFPQNLIIHRCRF